MFLATNGPGLRKTATHDERATHRALFVYIVRVANSPALDAVAQDTQAAQSADKTGTQPQSAATTVSQQPRQSADTTERQARSDSRESVKTALVVEHRRPPCQVPEHPKLVRERAFRLYCEDKTQVDIAFELQIPAGTIYGWCRRDKWELRKQAEKAGVNAETSASVAKSLAKTAKITEPSNLELAEKQERYQTLAGDAAVRFGEYLSTLEGEEITNKADKLLKADQIARKALKLETEKPSTVIQIGVLAQSPAKRIEQAAPDVLTLDV